MTGRLLLALFFIIAGILHFIFPEAYIRMVPPLVPWPAAMVWVSGVAEIMGGIGLLLPGWRRPAAWGLVLLLIAVFPANLYMAVAHVQFTGSPSTGLLSTGLLSKNWAQWLRLPLQLPLIYWAWRYTRD
jgi:uncharacterized membrane protein